MNTVKNIIITYRWWLLLACLTSQFFGIFNLLNIALAGTPEVNDSNRGACIDLYMLFMIIGFAVSFIIMELRTLANYQFPESLIRKYTTAFVTILIVIVSCLLFSMVVEYIGSLLTVGSPQASSFAIGGYIRYVSEDTGGFSILAFLTTFEMFVSTLIKNKNLHLGINLFMSGVFWVTIILLQLKELHHIFFYVFGVLSIVFLIVSYQIYKRWQPANSGFLMI